MARNRGFARIKEERKKKTFFKVLIDEDLSSESMRLVPHKLRRSIISQDLPVKVILKVVWGRSWTVKLTKFKGSYYLMEKKGWEKFLNDNNLGDKQFLTFTDEGNNCLRVNIFEKNSTEILEPRRRKTTINSSDVKKEDMSFECTRRGIEPKKERGEEEEKQKKYEKIKKEDVYNAASSSSVAKHKKKRAEEQEEQKKCKKMKTKAEITNGYNALASSSVVAFSFIITITSLRIVTIPRDFAKKHHMPKEKTEFVIHESNGKKSWKVSYCLLINQQRVFSSGWRVLTRDWGLAVGDFCTLTLVTPKEMVLQVFHS